MYVDGFEAVQLSQFTHVCMHIHTCICVQLRILYILSQCVGGSKNLPGGYISYTRVLVISTL